MLRPDSPRLLLLLPTVTYRTVAFIEAARRLGVAVTVASERPSTFERANPAGLVTFDFADPAHAAEQARAFARTHLVQADPASRSLLVEEFVPGREVAVEGLVSKGVLQVFAIFDKPDPLDGPFFEETIYVTPSRLARTAQKEIAACAQAAVTALGLREGPIHAEVRHNHRGAWLIELAARPIGGRCSGALRFESRDAGGEMRDASLEEIVIRHALGMESPTWERERQASGVMMIPVPGAGVVREVRGVDAARAVPLVEEIVITTHPGQTLVPWPE